MNSSGSGSGSTVYGGSTSCTSSDSGEIINISTTHRPLSSSLLGLPYRILDINHKTELLRGIWVAVAVTAAAD